MSLRLEVTSVAFNACSTLTANDSFSNGNVSSLAEPADTEYFNYIYRVIYAVGLLGNVFALVVWTRSGLKFTPVTYFQAICVADSLVLILHPLESLGINFARLPGLCQLVHVLFLAVEVFAVFLVLGLSVARYIELCHPLYSEVAITHKRTVKAILLLAAFSVVCSVVEAYIWHRKDRTNECQLRQNTPQSFMWTYAISVVVVLFLCPLLAVVVFNLLLVQRIRHRRRTSAAFSVAMVPDKHNMNLSVTFISLYLVVCEIVYAAVHITQYFVKDRDITADDAETDIKPRMTGRWRSHYTQSLPLLIVDVVALTSYAVNLTIFTLCSKTFRRAIRALFQRYSRRSSVVIEIQPVGTSSRSS